MATTFSNIYDLFLVGVRDYKLDKLFAISPTDLETYLQGFIMKAIPYFDNCKQNLEDFNSTTGTFNITLTLTEQNILSDLMTIQWLLKEIQDVTQFQNLLNDTDFKMYSMGQNLKEKSDYYKSIREIANQRMVDYGLKNNDWNSWAGGNFFG